MNISVLCAFRVLGFTEMDIFLSLALKLFQNHCHYITVNNIKECLSSPEAIYSLQ